MCRNAKNASVFISTDKSEPFMSYVCVCVMSAVDRSSIEKRLLHVRSESFEHADDVIDL